MTMMVRLKRVPISPDMFFKVMQSETAWRVTKGIPKDAILRGMTLDPYTQGLYLFVEHESFEAIDRNSIAPLLETEFLRIG